MTLTQLITTKQLEAREKFHHASILGDLYIDTVGGGVPLKEMGVFLDALILSTAHAVLDAVKELVPEEEENNYSTAYADWTPARAVEEESLTQGHNASRVELLSRLELFSSDAEEV